MEVLNNLAFGFEHALSIHNLLFCATGCLIGMLTFLILVPLAITSTDGWIRRLGKRWAKLHRLVYAAAITGTIHYLWGLSSKQGATPTFPILYAATFALLLGYRGYDRYRKQRMARA